MRIQSAHEHSVLQLRAANSGISLIDKAGFIIFGQLDRAIIPLELTNRIYH